MDNNNFPYFLPDSYGEIKAMEELSHGVYYIATVTNTEQLQLPSEYIVVTDLAPAVSAEAKVYGTKVGKDPTLYLYDLDNPTSGHYIVEYEVAKYKMISGVSLEPDESLLSISKYAAEYHPEYFGEIPVPIRTPWGQLTRYRILMPGVHWIETEEGKEALAVNYVIWSCDFSEATQACAQFAKEDLQDGVHACMATAFFARKDSCLAAFELWNDTEQIRKYIDYPTLMNAVWNEHPEYATAWNVREQKGLNDIPKLFMHELGLGSDLKNDQTIRITPEQGTQFWKF